eukprot:GEMP01029272.1.p1 GENE.GEMP01029272.1~~GEMP01029272.1.p1  ORF type:complete len:413 (+),score=87.06 GEMP01029272.1:27-1265(+)
MALALQREWDRELKRHQASVRATKPCVSLEGPRFSMSTNLPPISHRSFRHTVEQREVLRLNRILLRKIFAIVQRPAPKLSRPRLPKIGTSKDRSLELQQQKEQSRILNVKTCIPSEQSEKDFRKRQKYIKLLRKHPLPVVKTATTKKPPKGKPVIAVRELESSTEDVSMRRAARQLLLFFYQREFPDWDPNRHPGPHIMIRTPREGLRLDSKPTQAHRRLVTKQCLTDNILMLPFDVGSEPCEVPRDSWAEESYASRASNHPKKTGKKAGLRPKQEHFRVKQDAGARPEGGQASSGLDVRDLSIREQVMDMLDDMMTAGEMEKSYLEGEINRQGKVVHQVVQEFLAELYDRVVLEPDRRRRSCLSTPSTVFDADVSLPPTPCAMVEILIATALEAALENADQEESQERRSHS